MIPAARPETFSRFRAPTGYPGSALEGSVFVMGRKQCPMMTIKFVVDGVEMPATEGTNRPYVDARVPAGDPFPKVPKRPRRKRKKKG